MSGSGFTVKDWSQQSGLVFGLRVDQTAPNNYINPLIPYGENFHNPFNDSRFKKMPVRIIYSQEPEKIKPLDISHKPGKYQEAEQNNRILSNQSEIRIEQVWSMIDEVSSHSYGLSNHPPPLITTLKETAGNELDVEASVSGAGESLNIDHDKTYVQPQQRRASKRARTESERGKAYRESERGKAVRKASQKAYAKSEKGKASQKAYAKSEKGKACQKAYAKSEKGKACQKAYTQSKKGKASKRTRAESERRNAYTKAYRQSERGKAVRKAWFQSERGKASQKAYAQSEKGRARQKAYKQSERGRAARNAWSKSERGKACRRAYAQSERGKAVKRAWEQSEKGKAYRVSAKRKATYLAWAQSEKGQVVLKSYQHAYHKAYYKVFMSTGDRQLARSAGQQAGALIRVSDKATKNELESDSATSVLPAFKTD
ncbi:hypothetical protein [Endozoicomonas sp. ALB115]